MKKTALHKMIKVAMTSYSLVSIWVLFAHALWPHCFANQTAGLARDDLTRTLVSYSLRYSLNHYFE